MIFITGYMASGKTVLGKRLARYLGLPFYDLDAYIADKTGQSIPNLFALKGEDQFRILESELLRKLIATVPKDSVISLGGGTPCFHQNMEWILKNGLTVYLEASIAQILRHLQSAHLESRPLIAQKNLSHPTNLRAHYSPRVPFYEASHVKIPLKMAKNPDLLTKALILFTTTHPALNYLHEFP